MDKSKQPLPPLTPSARRIVKSGGVDAGFHKFEMTGDLYNNALCAQLGVPGIDDVPSVFRRPRKVWPVVLMVTVSLIQLTMAWTVYLHVSNKLIWASTAPLLTAYEMFVGSNITVPLHTVEALCGEWEDHEMKDFADGPLSFVKTADGSVFAPDDSYSLFYNVKQPTRTWNYAALDDYRSVLDDSMFVISEGLTLNPFTPSGYSLLFILTLTVFYLTMLIELRQTYQFGSMLLHFLCKGPKPDGCWAQGEQNGTTIGAINYGGHIVGALAFTCRASVAIVLAFLGSYFLQWTTVKIDLILNGLALVFLLELDTLVYKAAVPAIRQNWIKELEPVSYRVGGAEAGGFQHIMDSYAPLVLAPVSFFLACMVRLHQLQIFRNYFRLASAICLFAGPTTPFARHDIVHPVAGFCDSLLGVKCAPHVTPESTAQAHGYCLVTDKTVVNDATFSFYLDDPALYTNRYNEDGTMKSWTEWGEANPILYKSGLWMDGPYQDLLRKNCLALYQPTVKPDDVLVDDDAGETMDGAPFQCNREELFNAVFGKVFDSMDKLPIEKQMNLVARLDDPAVVKAMDNCKNYVEPPPKKKDDAALFFHQRRSRASLVDFGAIKLHKQRARLRHGKPAHIKPHTGPWWWRPKAHEAPL